MNFSLTEVERRARARADMRMAVPVVLSGAGHAFVAIAAELVTPGLLEKFRDLGDVVVVVTKRRAETLKARCYDGDIARIAVPADADTTWVHGIADPADDLRTPMKGPFHELRGGDPSAHRAAIELAKDAKLLPAALLVEAKDYGALKELTTVAVPFQKSGNEGTLCEVVSARVPLRVSEAGHVHVFRPLDGGEEHYAIEIGLPDRSKPVITRLHSACFTGDLLGSLKCDCGAQLNTALSIMGAEGQGILLYLNQEGRGIGLANKMRAYSLQDQGFDTVEANHRLGFEDDERDFRIGSEILRLMGFSSVRLLTNNPAKVAMMKANSIEVAQRLPLQVGENPLNVGYLRTKANKSGHIL